MGDPSAEARPRGSRPRATPLSLPRLAGGCALRSCVVTLRLTGDAAVSTQPWRLLAEARPPRRIAGVPLVLRGVLKIVRADRAPGPLSDGGDQRSGDQAPSRR